MKSISCILLLFCAFQSLCQHDLQLKITKIKKVEGSIGIWLYDSKETYMNGSKAIKSAWVEVTGNEVQHRFKGLAKGTYAIVIIQDLNGNGDLDTNWMGMPKEPYGFSTNPSTTFGPPDFEGAGFQIDSGKSLEIRLK